MENDLFHKWQFILSGRFNLIPHPAQQSTQNSSLKCCSDRLHMLQRNEITLLNIFDDKPIIKLIEVRNLKYVCRIVKLKYVRPWFHYSRKIWINEFESNLQMSIITS